ncbi:alpha-E domain-containing protein, partial [Thauera sp. 63]|uniref:alpha-E domain-containing protein n=1 Tax=Thauera sp. 63 TaxID=497321 RepID=UPI0018DED336
VLDHVGPAAGEAAAQADSPTVAALAELCRRCGVLPRAGERAEDAEGGEGGANAQALACALFDDTRSGSVVANLRMVLRLAAQLRDRLSPDSWRIYNRLAGFATPVTEAPGLGEAMHRLDESLLSLVTLSGFVIESMPRDAGWRFLSIGRRIERLQFLASALAVLLAVPQRGALEALLAVTDGEIRYRSRHARGLAPRPVAELVMFDGDNPRALRYQLDSLVDHLARLPDGAALGEPLAVLMRELDAVADCNCLAGLAADGRATHDAAACATVFGLLQRIWAAGNTLSDVLSQRYFTHLDARSHATASR